MTSEGALLFIYKKKLYVATWSNSHAMLTLTDGKSELDLSFTTRQKGSKIKGTIAKYFREQAFLFVENFIKSHLDDQEIEISYVQIDKDYLDA